MQPNDHLKKVVKILIFAFLCTEMHTKFTHDETKFATGLTESAELAGEQAAAYQASIRVLAEEQQHFGKGHICSGALIARSVVLTVAHCLQHPERQAAYHPAELRVILGSSQRFAPSTHTDAFGVTHVYLRDEGLALLMLDRDVPAKLPHIRPVALPELSNKAPTQANNDVWQVTGWGTDDAGRELHDLQARLAKQIDCQQPQQICVIYCAAGVTRLMHDAGAPLLQRSQLLGLQEAQGHFIDVAPHVDWIQQQIGDGGNQNSAVWGVLGFLAFTAYVLKCSCKSLLH